jgi:hypothetical protein
MADSIALTISTDGITSALKGMVSRAGLVRGWLNRVGYPIIIEAQRMRWASENATEGASWKPLSAKYEKYKTRRFASAPGGGRKMMIASGRLIAGVTGDDPKDHYKLVEDTKLSVGTTVPYAEYANEARNFTELSSTTTKELADKLGEYIRTGQS